MELELNDSEILAIERGPLAYAQKHQGSYRDLENFRRAIIAQFGEIGFQANVLCFETDQPDCYAFEFEITGRVPGTGRFDPDKQVHEVVNNILELPDQDQGWIKTDKAMLDDLASGNTRARGLHAH